MYRLSGFAKSALLLFTTLSSLSIFSMEPWVYNQDLRFRYNDESMTDQDGTSSSALNYRFTLGLPVISYRLGSVAISGTIDYDTLKIANEKASDFGLKGYGFTINLFPYRQFHLGFNYFHSDSPKLFNDTTYSTNRYGINYSVVRPGFPRIFARVERRENSLEGEKETWDQLEIQGTQKTKEWQYNFQVNRDVYNLQSTSQSWYSNYCSFDSERKLAHDWEFFGFASGLVLPGSWMASATSNLFGKWGKLYLGSGLTLGFGSSSGGGTSESLGVNQSVTIPLEHCSYYSSVSMSYDSTSSAKTARDSNSSGNVSYSFLAGGARQLGKSVNIYGDVLYNHLPATISGGDSIGYHVGISEGGFIPQIIQRTIFAISESSFNRRLKNEYPPNYLPPEIALDIIARKQAGMGSQLFSFDYYHMDGSGTQRRDYFRSDGMLRIGQHFQTQIRGEYTDETDEYGAKRSVDYLYLQTKLLLGRTSFFLSFGSSDGNSQPVGTEKQKQSSTSYSCGFNTIVWKMPFSAIYRILRTGDSQEYRSLYVYQAFRLRKISIRNGLEYGWLPDQRKFFRYTFEIGRSFDSMLLFGNRMRYR
jgi:hypothetical protein